MLNAMKENESQSFTELLIDVLISFLRSGLRPWYTVIMVYFKLKQVNLRLKS